jgi:adenine-specific DNA-methyltransferase
MAEFTYMGTKRALAKQIANVCDTARPGPFLELFSGLSAVGEELGMRRKIWCNDVQSFSQLYCQVRLGSPGHFDRLRKHITTDNEIYQANETGLNDKFKYLLDLETRALKTRDHKIIREAETTIRETVHKSSSGLRKGNVQCLFSTTHSGGYFSLAQGIQIDSIRAMIDGLHNASIINEQSKNYGVLALCRAVANASNSTGHFAQYLTPNENNITRVCTKRRVDVFEQFIIGISTLRPFGTTKWRKTNQFFSDDANTLLEKMSSRSKRPAVIYADPPYTGDQYSRFYHILETVVKYDYPKTEGKGQYREGRFSSPFSCKAGVENAFSTLISSSADMGSALVVSYPSSGLLKSSTEMITSLLRKSFREVHDPIDISHIHSTMGASKGPHQHQVKELLFVGHP